MSPSQYAYVDTGAQSADALISFQFDFSRTTSTDQHYFRLLRNATQLHEWNLDEFQKDRSSGTIMGTYIDTGHGTGSKYYYLQARKAVTTSNNANWSNIAMLAVGFRR